LSIRPTPSGENRNCPNEPAAVPAPNEIERQFSGRSLPNEGMIRLGESEPDQYARGQIELARRGRARHHVDAGGVEERADDDHADGAEFIGERAGKRLHHAVKQSLQGHREREHVAAPGIVQRHRRHEEAE
jgi:hypothetical protein